MQIRERNKEEALRSVRKMLGKERDCSQSRTNPGGGCYLGALCGINWAIGSPNQKRVANQPNPCPPKFAPVHTWVVLLAMSRAFL